MAIVTWPSNDNAFRLASFSRKQRHNLAVNVSSLNGATQTVALPGMRWVVTIGLPEQNYTERQRVAGFLASLAGGANRLALWDYANPQPARLSGSPLINGAVSQFANTLNIDGVIFGGDNLLAQSQAFDNAAWTKSSTTVSPNVVTAPDGAASADKLIEAVASAQHFAFQNTAAAVTAGTPITQSVYALAGGRAFIANLQGSAFSSPRYGHFDPSSGALGGVSGAGCTQSIQAAPGGWYRCSITATPDVTAVCQARVWLTNQSTVNAFIGTSVYAGDGSSGVHLWGAKLNVGATATDYTGLPALLTGDWISVPLSTGLNQLLRVTADVQGETLSSVPVADALRASVADNAVVTITKPVGLYVPVDPNALEEPYGGFHRCPATTFDLVEVFS